MTHVLEHLLLVCSNIAISFNRALEETNYPDESETAEYSIVLHNDDVHTFGEVTAALIGSRRVGMTRARVDQATDLVNRVGRAAVATCKGWTAARATAAELRPAGLIMSMPGTGQLAMEKAALGLIAWLRQTVGRSPGFTRLLLEEITMPCLNDTPHEAFAPWAAHVTHQRAPKFWPRHAHFLSILIYLHTILPKQLALKIADLFMKCISDEVFKCELGCALGSALPDLHALFACGIGTAEDTLFRLAVQLFTTQSVVAGFQQETGEPMLAKAFEAFRVRFTVCSLL